MQPAKCCPDVGTANNACFIVPQEYRNGLPTLARTSKVKFGQIAPKHLNVFEGSLLFNIDLVAAHADLPEPLRTDRLRVDCFLLRRSTLCVRAFAAARMRSRRLVRIASASGTAMTASSMCLHKSGSLIVDRSSARNGWILLNVAKISL